MALITKEERGWEETPPLSPTIRHLIGELVERQTWLDKWADPIQQWLLKIFGPPGQPKRKIKDMLNGTWLGHGIHPILTDIPLGAWSGTVLLDLVSLNDESEGVARGADLTLLLGLAGAAGSAVTGWTDWSDLDGTDRRVGLIHGLLNGGVTMMYFTSWLLRLMGQRRTAIAISTTGYMASLFTAYLGGEMTFAKGVGVNRVAYEGGSDEFVAVMNEQELVEGKLTRVDAAGIPAVLLKEGKTIYAIGATCTHRGAPLEEGEVKDGVVTCPWHGSRFCMADGSVVTGPAVYAEPTFAVRVDGGKIRLRRLEHA